MKKKAVMAISFISVLSIIAAGCSGSSSPTTASGQSSKASDSGAAGTDSGNKKVTLKVLVKGNSLVQDFKTNDYTKWLEEKTGVHVEWTVSDEKNYKDQLNLALASGDLPDVIMNMDVSPAQQMIYGEQGLFVPFNDLIDKYGVNTKKIFQEMPEVKDVVTAPGGKIYSLPYVNECYHCSMDYKMYVFQPWLKKLNLKEPTTTDEFEQMLKAFKEKDPNGNGKADEIGLAASTDSRSQLDVFLMNAFIYDDGDKRLILNNGKIDVAYNKPQWKAGLQYIHKLYSEGLIAPQSLTQDAASLKKIAENPGTAIAGAIPAHSPSSITIVEGESGRWLDYQPIAPLKGPEGVQQSVWMPYSKVANGEFIMTKADKYPAETMKWADFQYNFEANLHSNFGNEGTSWVQAKPGDKGRGGAEAKYELLIPFGRVQNESWAQEGLDYRTDKDWYAGQAVQKQPDKENMYYQVTKERYEPFKPSIDKIIPPLYFSKQDSEQLADLDKTINDYVKNMTARFISGDADINKEWDNYVTTLDKMNLKGYLAINQKAYDSTHK